MADLSAPSVLLPFSPSFQFFNTLQRFSYYHPTDRKAESSEEDIKRQRKLDAIFSNRASEQSKRRSLSTSSPSVPSVASTLPPVSASMPRAQRSSIEGNSEPPSPRAGPPSGPVSRGASPPLPDDEEEIRRMISDNIRAINELDFVVYLPTERPAWQKDEECTNCNSCKCVFNVVNRRHHCRNCGLIFCAKCCNQKTKMVNLNYKTPQLVCNGCVGQYKDETL